MAAKKVSKQTKKFNKNHLDHTLTTRRKHQAKRKEIEGRKKLKSIKISRNGKSSLKGSTDRASDQDESDDDDDSVTEQKNGLDMSVEALLNAKGVQTDNEETDEEEPGTDNDDLESLLSIQDDSNPMMDLKSLKEKDPEFYKYLQENDKELLEFDADALEQEAEDDISDQQSVSNEDNQHNHKPQQVVLTKELLRSWQKAILETRSLRALRKLLLAFKSAALSNKDQTSDLPFLIESSAVFDALVTTTFKYLPVFLNQCVPIKQLPNGKSKVAKHTKMYSAMQRVLKSYFGSLLELISQLPAQIREGGKHDQTSMLHTAISESAKLSPWICTNGKIVRAWSKTLLDLWASSTDEVRVAAVLALRRIIVSSEKPTADSVLKGVYTNLIRNAKSTSSFTLPTINLMKNSASELYQIDHEGSYPIVFSFIRQLAIHLRNSMKLNNQEGFQAVYNWQFIHSLDFWSLVLSSACDLNDSSRSHQGSLQPLIYPLVQITTGVIKLIPTSRHYPLRFHCIKLLLRLQQRTGTFIPLTSLLLDTLESPLFKRRIKRSSLKALDFQYLVRCPKSHENSSVYADGVVEETVYHLLEYYCLLSKSIAFPELVLPALVLLKRSIKQSKNSKLVGQLKTLVDKIEANRTFIEAQRIGVHLKSDSLSDSPERFLEKLDTSKTPLGAYHRLQSKVRDQKRAAIDLSAQVQIEKD